MGAENVVQTVIVEVLIHWSRLAWFSGLNSWKHIIVRRDMIDRRGRK